MAFLEGRGVSKRYGGLEALKGVDFALEERQLVALIGPNGSGKTTLFEIISGLIRPTAGEVRLRGVRITGLPAHTIARLGVGRTFQIARPFPGLTVLDNVLVGVSFGRARRLRPEERRREALRLLEVVGLADKAATLARHLSLGELKRLELASALATRPDLLLLDELTSGLPPKGREEVIRFYGQLRERGLTIFAIEHSFRVLTALADRVLVLDQGELIADGPPAEVMASRRVVEAYLGEED